MSENQKKILQMLAEGKIKVDEAHKLLSLVDSRDDTEDMNSKSETGTKTSPRFLHIIVEPKTTVGADGNKNQQGKHKVNIRVPFGLIRAGVKLATLMPSETAEHMDKAFKEKGFNFDIRRLKEADLEDMLSALRDNEIDVDSENERVRLYAE
jgi:hypothetical protein